MDYRYIHLIITRTCISRYLTERHDLETNIRDSLRVVIQPNHAIPAAHLSRNLLRVPAYCHAAPSRERAIISGR